MCPVLISLQPSWLALAGELAGPVGSWETEVKHSFPAAGRCSRRQLWVELEQRAGGTAIAITGKTGRIKTSNARQYWN